MRKPTSEGATLWFTGLSGAGKSTLSRRLKAYIEDQLKIKCIILDADNVRKGLNKDLKFTKEDSIENVRRMAQMSKIINSQGLFVVVCCISPYSENRQEARRIHTQQNLNFYEIHIAADLQTCRKRDVKGLYKLEEEGKVTNFNNKECPYQVPVNPQLCIQTGKQGKDECFLRLLSFLNQRGHIQKSRLQISKENAFENKTNCSETEQFNSTI